jgi:pimeloyl-ACP methyl ester carboxylesterase
MPPSYSNTVAAWSSLSDVAAIETEPAAWMRSSRSLHALLEWPRAIAEAATLGPCLPLLWRAPSGDGHPVLVLPGFLADDASTQVLRFFLRDRGYATYGWQLGMNLGVGDGLVRLLGVRIVDLHRELGRRISLVGWSLGGVIARELARTHPGIVRQVVTMGSPFGPSEPPPVPCTSIYTRSDGIVPWRSCLELPSPTTENIEVRGSHVGLGFNATVLYAVADRLALREGGWRPFVRNGFRDLLYPESPTAHGSATR